MDLNQPALQQNDLFADPSHLNQFGAVAVAEAIAQSTAVNWGAPRTEQTPETSEASSE
jgi:hypothetical protein